MLLVVQLTMVAERDYLIHPYYILITLLLGSITALFLGFTAAYIYTRVQHGIAPVNVPNLFYINTFFLLGTSFVLWKTKKAYEMDDTAGYKNYLSLSLILSLLFLVAQVFAWAQLHKMNIGLTSSPLASYLYIISGIHFIHLVAGIPFLIFFILDAHKRLIEPASVLVYLSDPDKKRKLKVLSIYWHFLDILWIYLVLFFVLNLWI